VVSPAHGRVDVIDTVTEPQFMGRGMPAHFHVFVRHERARAERAGGRQDRLFKYTEGQFLNAMRTECAACNENALIGIEAAEPRGIKVGVRVIAGVLAAASWAWVAPGDEVARGERISLNPIRFARGVVPAGFGPDQSEAGRQGGGRGNRDCGIRIGTSMAAPSPHSQPADAPELRLKIYVLPNLLTAGTSSAGSWR